MKFAYQYHGPGYSTDKATGKPDGWLSEPDMKCCIRPKNTKGDVKLSFFIQSPEGAHGTTVAVDEIMDAMKPAGQKYTKSPANLYVHEPGNISFKSDYHTKIWFRTSGRKLPNNSLSIHIGDYPNGAGILFTPQQKHHFKNYVLYIRDKNPSDIPRQINEYHPIAPEGTEQPIP